MLQVMVVAFVIAAPPPVVDANDVPFTFDPNFCAYPVMDWAISEPNLSITYAVELVSKSGRAATLQIWDGSGVLIDPYIRYDGRVKDPNGWAHKWQIFHVPRYEGVHHLNIKATYGKRSWTNAWGLLAGPTTSDGRTILLLAVKDDSPYLRPDLTVFPVARINRAQNGWQAAMKVERNFGMTKIVR
jgi:hypothetical protein